MGQCGMPLSLLSLSLTSVSVGVASRPRLSLCRASDTEVMIKSDQSKIKYTIYISLIWII